MRTYKETVEYLIRRASRNNKLFTPVLEEICGIFGYTYKLIADNKNKLKIKVEIYGKQDKIKTLSGDARLLFILKQLKDKDISEQNYKEILERILNKR